MHERVVAAIIGLDESKTLLEIEEFDCSCGHDRPFQKYRILNGSIAEDKNRVFGFELIDLGE
jgi:hypothetical protein